MKRNIELLSLREMIDLPTSEKEEYGLLYTPQEIYQQPDTWRETLQVVAAQQTDLKDFLQECGINGSERDRAQVWLVGAGTSDYIARSLVRLFRQKWNCQVHAVPSTDLQIEMDDLMTASKADRHLWISFSRSGESYESVKVIERALEKYPDIRHLIITCNKDGQMAKQIANDPGVYCLLLDDKVNDRGVAMTSSFTNLLVAGQCIASMADLEYYEPILNSMSNTGAKILPFMGDLARKLASDESARICFLGNGTLKGIADECALKVLEFTDGRVSTMAETFLSVRHGPLSWFDSEILVVAFLSGNHETSPFEIGLLKQLKERNLARIILAVTPQPDSSVSAYADHVIVLDLPDFITDDYFSVLDILFGQCLGLYASLRSGLKPDTPSVDGPVQRVISEISVV